MSHPGPGHPLSSRETTVGLVLAALASRSAATAARLLLACVCAGGGGHGSWAMKHGPDQGQSHLTGSLAETKPPTIPYLDDQCRPEDI